MDINKYIVKEIFSALPIGTNKGNMASLIPLMDYATYIVHNDEKNILTYRANVDEIIKNNMPISNLVELRDYGWELSEDESYIFKVIK